MEDKPVDDIQCQRILNGIGGPLLLLEKDLISNVLEIGKPSGTDEKHQILNRLKRSLKQYLSKGRDFLYIGFLGHFSSGKSTTINSLLGGLSNYAQLQGEEN